jgi:hypothetical protein
MIHIQRKKINETDTEEKEIVLMKISGHVRDGIFTFICYKKQK